MNPALTMPPGVHALLASVLTVIGPSVRSARLVLVLLAAVTLVTFYRSVQALGHHSPGIRTVQFTMLPMLFHQFFLIYTDVVSLLCVLLMVRATMARSLRVAGAIGLVACVMRQDNIVWAAWAVAWSYLDRYGWTWRPLREIVSE